MTNQNIMRNNQVFDIFTIYCMYIGFNQKQLPQTQETYKEIRKALQKHGDQTRRCTQCSNTIAAQPSSTRLYCKVEAISKKVMPPACVCLHYDKKE